MRGWMIGTAALCIATAAEAGEYVTTDKLMACDETSMTRLNQLLGDKDTWKAFFFSEVANGRCALLDAGTGVVVESAGLLTTRIHVAGDPRPWWTPTDVLKNRVRAR